MHLGNIISTLRGDVIICVGDLVSASGEGVFSALEGYYKCIGSVQCIGGHHQ